MKMSEGTHQLWILMMLIIGFGYLIMFMYAVVLLIGVIGLAVLLLCYNKDQIREIRETLLSDGAIVNKIPYIDVLRGAFVKKQFGKVKKEHRTMESCAICLVEYNEKDDVAELKCDNRHYFHSGCLEDWLKRKAECPLCKTPVNTAGANGPSIPGSD